MLMQCLYVVFKYQARFQGKVGKESQHVLVDESISHC